tara:strand:- start:3187 stop:3387 length:201 start_codon:yes stop_codon:yes gene_type:complete
MTNESNVKQEPIIKLLSSLTDTMVKLSKAMEGMSDRLVTLETIHKSSYKKEIDKLLSKTEKKQLKS